MWGRLLYSFGVVIGLFAIIFLPYYFVIYKISAEKYRELNKFQIWLAGFITILVTALLLFAFLKIIELIYLWIKWVVTGRWGHDKEDE